MRQGPERQADRALNLVSEIESTSRDRARYTRRFLRTIGKSASDFINQVSQILPEIEVNFDDDVSLTLAVFKLQKCLFPAESSKHHYDARFGPYTNKMLQARLIKKEKPSLRGQISDYFGRLAKEFNPNPEAAPESNNQLEPISLSESVFIGDSHSVRMGSHIRGAYSLYKGSMQTDWMRQQLEKFLAERKAGKHPNAKRIVVMGGFNDISSTNGAQHVIDNLEKMYKAAKAEGLEVVACTIPDWKEKQLQPIWVRRWKEKGWGKEKGVYPYSAEELADQTAQVNKWILKQQGGLVDLALSVDKQGFEISRDGVHRTREGAKKMAAFIKEQAKLG